MWLFVGTGQFLMILENHPDTANRLWPYLSGPLETQEMNCGKEYLVPLKLGGGFPVMYF